MSMLFEIVERANTSGKVNMSVIRVSDDKWQITISPGYACPFSTGKNASIDIFLSVEEVDHHDFHFRRKLFAELSDRLEFEAVLISSRNCYTPSHVEGALACVNEVKKWAEWVCYSAYFLESCLDEILGIGKMINL